MILVRWVVDVKLADFVIVCDATQFYSEVGGGVGRYLREKRAYVRDHTTDEHILLVPGAEDRIERDGRLTLCTVRSHSLNATSRYRVLLRLQRAQEMLMELRPDVIESGDPYHLGWKLIHAGQLLGVPVVGFYHSHFPEAYLRTVLKYAGPWMRDVVMAYAQDYITRLYNDFDATWVPSEFLRELLEDWGVGNTRTLHLGVNTGVFNPDAPPLDRAALGIDDDRILLLYVGRLAGEKNTRTLIRAFEELRRRSPKRYAFVVVGDGTHRSALTDWAGRKGEFYWEPYCDDSQRLAGFYRMADCFVHPGVCETFGLVALESQACGCPVVGIRGSYMDANIFAGLDLWAAENTAEALADAVERVADADPAGLGADAGVVVRERFSWNAVFARQWQLYREVIARRREHQRHGGLFQP